MAKGDVKILILGDASDAKKAFADAEKHANNFQGGVSKSFAESGRQADGLGQKFSGIGKVLGGLGAMFAGGALFGFLNDSVTAASDLNETVSKAKTVFGGASDSVLKMGEDSATALRMSKNEAIGAAATYGNLFRAVGLNEDAAAGMSTKMVGLAADLASFNNVPVEEALLAIQAGLVGETEPLRRFGANLSAVRVDAEALRLGLVKGNVSLADVETATVGVTKANLAAQKALKEHGAGSIEYRDALAKVEQAEGTLAGKMQGKVPDLDAAQKAQAAYSLILQDTSLAQGDAARTADGYAGKVAIQKARMEDLKTEIGEKLLPVWLWSMEAMNMAADKVKQWWEDNGEPLKKKFTDTFGTDPIENFKRGLTEAGAIWDDFKGRVMKAYGEFERGSAIVYNTIGPAWEWFGDKVLWLKDKVLDPLWGSIQRGVAGTVQAFGALGRVLDPIVGTIQKILDGMDGMSKFTANPVNETLKKFGFGGFATGGYLPDGLSWVGENGPELARTHGGQTYITPNQQSNWSAPGTRYEDGSWAGMTAAERAAFDFAEGYTKGGPNPFAGWDTNADFSQWGKNNPFAGWDPKADFSQWGKPPPAPARATGGQHVTETINLILDGQKIATHIRRRELQIR